MDKSVQINSTTTVKTQSAFALQIAFRFRPRKLRTKLKVAERSPMAIRPCNAYLGLSGSLRNEKARSTAIQPVAITRLRTITDDPFLLSAFCLLISNQPHRLRLLDELHGAQDDGRIDHF